MRKYETNGKAKEEERKMLANGMMAGIDILHKYMKFIDDKTIVIMHIG